MLFRVIDPDQPVVGRSNYVLPDGLQHGDEVAVPRPVEGMLGAGSSAGPDGRIARAGVPACEPPEQLPWGFGYARSRARDEPELALTELPADPAGFTVRQQDAVRRDVAERLANYMDYAPVPFAGASEVISSQ